MRTSLFDLGIVVIVSQLLSDVLSAVPRESWRNAEYGLFSFDPFLTRNGSPRSLRL